MTWLTGNGRGAETFLHSSVFWHHVSWICSLFVILWLASLPFHCSIVSAEILLNLLWTTVLVKDIFSIKAKGYETVLMAVYDSSTWTLPLLLWWEIFQGLAEHIFIYIPIYVKQFIGIGIQIGDMISTANFWPYSQVRGKGSWQLCKQQRLNTTAAILKKIMLLNSIFEN